MNFRVCVMEVNIKHSLGQVSNFKLGCFAEQKVARFEP